MMVFLDPFYRFDPHATQFIAFGELSDFVTSLDSPLGIPRPNMAALVNLDIPIASGDRVHCLDILHALTRRVLGDVEDTEHFRKLQQQMDEKFKKQFPTRREIEVVSSTAKWKQRDTAVRVIQKAYRRYLRYLIRRRALCFSAPFVMPVDSANNSNLRPPCSASTPL